MKNTVVRTWSTDKAGNDYSDWNFTNANIKHQLGVEWMTRQSKEQSSQIGDMLIDNRYYPALDNSGAQVWTKHN